MLEILLDNVPDSVEVMVISRWEKVDLLKKVSDLEVYEFCRDRGWKFLINPRLHGKFIAFDSNKILLGSSNFTQRGLGLSKNYNLEYGLKTVIDQKDRELIAHLVDESLVMDDQIFGLIKQEVLNSSDTLVPDINLEWSAEVSQLIANFSSNIFLIDIPEATPLEILQLSNHNEKVKNTLHLLNISGELLSEELLIEKFKLLKIYSVISSWLTPELNFGKASEKLHNILDDVPIPLRSDVKIKVAVLFKWFSFIKNEYEIVIYNHSEVLRKF